MQHPGRYFGSLVRRGKRRGRGSTGVEEAAANVTPEVAALKIATSRSGCLEPASLPCGGGKAPLAQQDCGALSQALTTTGGGGAEQGVQAVDSHCPLVPQFAHLHTSTFTSLGEGGGLQTGAGAFPARCLRSRIPLRSQGQMVLLERCFTSPWEQCLEQGRVGE